MITTNQYIDQKVQEILILKDHPKDKITALSIEVVSQITSMYARYLLKNLAHAVEGCSTLGEVIAIIKRTESQIK